jgi:hypothetical protein
MKKLLLVILIIGIYSFTIKKNNVTLNPIEKIWLNLSSDSGNFNQILVAFLENTTDGFDNQYDALRPNSGNLSFFSIIPVNQYLAIQALPPFTNTKTIQLGYEYINTSTSSLTISIDHSEYFQDIDVILIDNLLNTTHNLNLSDYNFSVSQTGLVNNRFQIQFTRQTISVENHTIKENLILINRNENQIEIKSTSNQLIEQLDVYNILGKLVFQSKPKTHKFTININQKKGTLLFFKAKLKNGKIISKKIIKL